LLHEQQAVDIAMFGRMLASKTQFNGEAAVQVAHAIGVHASPIEDDYFTAVDDLNVSDPGAAHIGEAGFAAAVFYQYICVDRELLLSNLGGDEALLSRALRGLTEAALKVGPSGKQNSFASRAYAHFALAEKGNQQPRSLALAFLQPVKGEDYGVEAVRKLRQLVSNMDSVYGPCSDCHECFDVLQGEGSSQALIDFVAEA
jgi:CRISPR system Cascade subunit CasC